MNLRERLFGFFKEDPRKQQIIELANRVHQKIGDNLPIAGFSTVVWPPESNLIAGANEDEPFSVRVIRDSSGNLNASYARNGKVVSFEIHGENIRVRRGTVNDKVDFFREIDDPWNRKIASWQFADRFFDRVIALRQTQTAE